MREGKHSQPDDNTFVMSLGRHLGSAVALVLVVAAAFWGVGQFRTATPDGPVIAGEPSPSITATASPTGEPTVEPTGEPSVDATASPTDEPTVEPSPEPSVVPSASPSASPRPSASPSVKPTPSPTASAGSLAASDISVQILDAVLEDGGAKAKDASERLKGDGYRVVASNKASKVYPNTTVFYSPGNKAKADHVAAKYGLSRVEPMPDNLSDSVAVHLVVGQDWKS